MEGILAVTFIFGGGSLFLLAISPVGKAIAERIQGGGRGGDGEAVERIEASQQHVLDEMEHMRQDLMEMQERLDFAERLLARTRESLPRIEAAGEDQP